MFELVDAVLCADGAVKSPVDLTLLPEHRRGHGAVYGGLNHGRIDVDQLRAVLAGLSLPRFDGGRDSSPQAGDPAIVIVSDAGYDVTRLAWVLRDLPVELVGRVRSDRVLGAERPSGTGATRLGGAPL